VRKISLIARREFLAAVANKGFVLGLLLMPILGAAFAVALPRVFLPGNDPIRGSVVLIDPTGQVAADVRAAFDPKGMAARRDGEMREALRRAGSTVMRVAGADQFVLNAVGPSATLTILERPRGANPLDEKTWLLADRPNERHLAVVAIHTNAVTAGPDGQLGTYDLYVPASLNFRTEGVLHDGIRTAIVTARARARQMQREQVEALTTVSRPSSVTVTAQRDRRSVGGFNVLLPLVFVGLLVFGVMIGGQTLLTNTIEEKSSRVIEVLLSAVSPLELMAGKILGQLGVSLLVLTVYMGIGILLLVSFALVGLLDPWLVVYLLVFFLITYCLFAAVFAAAGAAVNDLKEAQTLMGPIMLLLMGPWLVAFPIARDPNSTMAVVLSFVPPVNSFVMMIRLSSSTPPPTWQALLSVVIGIGATVVGIWFASKIFRIGLLMHGKPPNLRTLLRWARAA
jgi:ABC-2 type transport system permease protein